MLIALAIAAGIAAGIIVLAVFYSPRPVARRYDNTLPVFTGHTLTPQQVARLRRIKRVTLDADAILQRVCRGQTASRGYMASRGMSARRWTAATHTLRELGILSDGETVAALDFNEARNRLKYWYQARKMRVQDSPTFVPGYSNSDTNAVTLGAVSSVSRGTGRNRTIRARGR